jgi:hypothetical protein
MRNTYFEVVPEGKAAKNRLHLNIRAVDRVAEVKRLVALGATEIEEMSPGGGYVWTNMKDVEGRSSASRRYDFGQKAIGHYCARRISRQ